MIYTSRDTLRAVLFEYRDAVRPIGDWIGLLGLVISLWALRGTVAHPGWQEAVAASPPADADTRKTTDRK
jgi:hypothetical protein